MRSDWKDCTLADLGEIVTGKTPSTMVADYFSDKYPFITPRDIQVTKHIFSCERYLSQAGLEVVKKCLLPPNAICVSCIGNLGYVGMTTTESVTNQQINSIIPDCSNFDPDFIFYLVKFLNPFFKNLEGQSTTLSILNKTMFSQITIKVPATIDAQRSISKVLNSLDEKIELNTKINYHLEQMAQAIFKSWFVDFEPWGGEMPDAWQEAEFSTFLTPRTEKSDDPTIPVFSVTDTGIVPRAEKFNKKLSKADTKNKIIRATDLVFGMSREILNWGIMRTQVGGVSLAYNVFEVHGRINSKYLESFISAQTLYFKDLIRPATREGQGIDKGALMLKAIPLPPDKVLAEYYAIEDALTVQIKGNEAKSARLAELRDTLLPRLMSGQLSVTHLSDTKC